MRGARIMHALLNLGQKPEHACLHPAEACSRQATNDRSNGALNFFYRLKLSKIKRLFNLAKTPFKNMFFKGKKKEYFFCFRFKKFMFQKKKKRKQFFEIKTKKQKEIIPCDP